MSCRISSRGRVLYLPPVPSTEGEPTITILSWGVGVQSTAMAAMVALGDLPPVDIVIHIDTGWERKPTIASRDWYTAWLLDHGVNVETHKGQYDVKLDGAAAHRHIPLWTTGGPLTRQCTREYKIRPMRRRVRELMGYHRSDPPHPPKGSVEQWIGITTDEAKRESESRVAYVVKRYPLLEKGLSRQDCVTYLEEHGLPVPVRSHCACCPLQTAREWLEVKREDPEGWEDLIAFDEYVRDNPLLGKGVRTAELFVYVGRIPLAEADLVADAKRCR